MSCGCMLHGHHITKLFYICLMFGSNSVCLFLDTCGVHKYKSPICHSEHVSTFLTCSTTKHSGNSHFSKMSMIRDNLVLVIVDQSSSRIWDSHVTSVWSKSVLCWLVFNGRTSNKVRTFTALSNVSHHMCLAWRVSWWMKQFTLSVSSCTSLYKWLIHSFTPAISFAPLLQMAVNLDLSAFCSCIKSSVNWIISCSVVLLSNGRQNKMSSKEATCTG